MLPGFVDKPFLLTGAAFITSYFISGLVFCVRAPVLLWYVLRRGVALLHSTVTLDASWRVLHAVVGAVFLWIRELLFFIVSPSILVAAGALLSTAYW